jgi:hypothetical protein
MREERVKKRERYTSAIPGNAVDYSIVAHLEEALFAWPTGTCLVN